MKEKDAIPFVMGVLAMLRELLLPGVPREKRGYVDLIYAFWGLRPANSEFRFKTSQEAKKIARSFLSQYEGATWPCTPQQDDEYMTGFVSWILKQYRSAIRPIWDADAFRMIEEALEKLRWEERDVLRRHFGLDHSRQSLDTIARAHGCSREKVTRIQRDALHKLPRKLSVLIEPIGEFSPKALLRERQYQLALSELHQEAIEEDERWEVKRGNRNAFRKHVDECELSVRAYNTLRNTDLLYLGEIAQMTPRQFSSLRGMTRTVFREMEKLLEAHNLPFGTKLTAEQGAILVELRRPRQVDQSLDALDEMIAGK